MRDRSGRDAQLRLCGQGVCSCEFEERRAALSDMDVPNKVWVQGISEPGASPRASARAKTRSWRPALNYRERHATDLRKV
jgi:hypothetical protein